METLSQKQIKRLQNILRGRGFSPEDAEDHVQEAITRMYEYEGEVRNPEAFVCTAAINEALGAYRHRRRWPTTQVPEALEDPFSPPEDAVVAKIRLRELVELLDNVSVKTRTIYIAHRSGYAYSEIASEMGMSMRIVEKHVLRGIKLMRGETP